MDGERAAAIAGAQRALACAGHELSSPLAALFTYLSLLPRAAPGAAELTASLRACAVRLREIADTARGLGAVGEPPAAVELDPILVDAGAQLDGPAAPAAWIAPRAAAVVVRGVIAAVRRSAPDGAAVLAARAAGDRRTLVRVVADGAGAAGTSRAIEPFAADRVGLDLWVAAATVAAAGGEVRVGDAGGVLAVEVALPAAEPP
ncbi:MAG TPA: hypothetical protein VM734_25025 [Kofleriaceae bacterium]|nr:hypothetical protein [Kofleriaceae bacterium]